MSENSFLKELQKRKVVQVAAIYGAVAWGLTEVVVTIVSQLFLPQWVSTLAVIGFVVGFPVAMFLAWTFDITPDGIQRTSISSRKGRASIVGSMLLLVAATAGLFLLIRPALEGSDAAKEPPPIPPGSIAVLPFENASEDPDDEFLSQGLSDELRDQLGGVSGLRVAARSSSRAVVEQSGGAKATSKMLGVAAIIEGSVRRSGNGMRVSVQLIEGRTGLSLWSQTYDRSRQEILFVQQEIAEQIVQLMLPNTQAKVAAVSTRSVSVRELMWRARFLEQKVRDNPVVDEATLLEAVRLYREATRIEPQSAIAQSRLAGALLYLGDVNGAEGPIFRALSLDPDLSEVQATVGLFHMSRGEPGGLAALKRAVELNPNNADALSAYAYLYWMQGHDDISAGLYRRALVLDPLSLSRYAALGEFLGKNSRVNEVMEIVSSVQERFDGVQSFRVIGDLLEYTGKLDETIAWTIKARNLEPANPDHRERLADLHAQIGDDVTAEALQPEPDIGLLFRMRRYQAVVDNGELLMIEEPEDVLVRYTLAFAYDAMGQHHLAIRILRLSGLPDIVLEETMRAIDLNAYITLANAVYGAGELEIAHGLADYWLTKSHADPEDWWNPTLDTCMLLIMGRDDEALSRFEDVRNSPRIPWESMTRDSTCFKRVSDNPRYRAVLQHADERRAEIRARLPATLARYGVSLFDQSEPPK